MSKTINQFAIIILLFTFLLAGAEVRADEKEVTWATLGGAEHHTKVGTIDCIVTDKGGSIVLEGVDHSYRKEGVKGAFFVDQTIVLGKGTVTVFAHRIGEMDAKKSAKDGEYDVFSTHCARHLHALGDELVERIEWFGYSVPKP